MSHGEESRPLLMLGYSSICLRCSCFSLFYCCRHSCQTSFQREQYVCLWLPVQCDLDFAPRASLLSFSLLLLLLLSLLLLRSPLRSALRLVHGAAYSAAQSPVRALLDCNSAGHILPTAELRPTTSSLASPGIAMWIFTAALSLSCYWFSSLDSTGTSVLLRPLFRRSRATGNAGSPTFVSADNS